MIERHRESDFLPDFYVFPGGRVDDGDRALADRVSGVDRARAAELLEGSDPELALSFFVAAIRESFEETGIALARRRGAPDLLDADSAAELASQRLEVQAGRTSFRDLIDANDLELAADLLAVHAHWITPEPVPRRFDTWFFTALTPPGQLAAHDGVETSAHVWIRPEDALEQMRAGQRRIIFPTAANLETLTGFKTVGDALQCSRERPVPPVLPVLVERDGERKLVIPADAGYPIREEPIPKPGR